jgi:hypothetical protein
MLARRESRDSFKGPCWYFLDEYKLGVTADGNKYMSRICSANHAALFKIINKRLHLHFQ